MKKKIHIVITGKVQGIGFRYWLYQIANEKNVYGWVKNKNTNNSLQIFQYLLGNFILSLTTIGPIIELNNVPGNEPMENAANIKPEMLLLK